MAHVRSFAPSRPCAYCGRSFAPRRDEIAKGRGGFCSRGCSNLSRQNGLPLDPKTLRRMYVEERQQIDRIATTLKSHRRAVRRALVDLGIPIRSGGCLPTENCPRTTYRKEASKSIGRKLKRGETVHHIDVDRTNNAPGNLAVLPSRTAHQLAHRQLESLAAQLVRAKLILWADGSYTFSGTMEGLLKHV